jgi:hypothetical protein
VLQVVGAPGDESPCLHLHEGQRETLVVAMVAEVVRRLVGWIAAGCAKQSWGWHSVA